MSEEIEGSVTKKLSQEFSMIENRILGALFNLEDVLLNPQAQTQSRTFPNTFWNSNTENQEGDEDRSQNDPRPEVGTSNLWIQIQKMHLIMHLWYTVISLMVRRWTCIQVQRWTINEITVYHRWRVRKFLNHWLPSDRSYFSLAVVQKIQGGLSMIHGTLWKQCR